MEKRGIDVESLSLFSTNIPTISGLKIFKSEEKENEQFYYIKTRRNRNISLCIWIKS